MPYGLTILLCPFPHNDFITLSDILLAGRNSRNIFQDKAVFRDRVIIMICGELSSRLPKAKYALKTRA